MASKTPDSSDNEMGHASALADELVFGLHRFETSTFADALRRSHESVRVLVFRELEKRIDFKKGLRVIDDPEELHDLFLRLKQAGVPVPPGSTEPDTVDKLQFKERLLARVREYAKSKEYIQVSTQEMSERIVDAFKEHVESKFGELPVDYDVRRRALISLQQAMREAATKTITSEFNDHLATLPKDSYEDKKAIAKWVNAELRQLGLTLKCPKTSQPAILVGSPTGQPGVGRFQFEVILENGRPHRTLSTSTLPKLELLPIPAYRDTSPPESEKGRTR